MVVRPKRSEKEWHRLVDGCLLVDQHRLRRMVKKVAARAEDDPETQRFVQRLEKSAARRQARQWAARRPALRVLWR